MTRFNVRGGIRLRKLYNITQRSKREVHTCNWCCRTTYMWVSVGVWTCRKCSFTQAGAAFSLN